ncbi:copper amine oxidase [Cohnella fermenti]|uniref:Copper amine oxidase n=1 Tax=Cohnella fermenti TaxID=2565925 RepID=A0A4S4BIP7_9BACL|nr:copper amine oxidase [Cohnella fermenti]THF73878.1 copper amine oxidase [Cohnella fermenti]
MKFRRILILTAVMTLAFGSGVFADTISQKVKLILNKQEVSDADTAMIGKEAYVSVKSLGDLVQGMVFWDDDTKKATIFKPNVHMFLMAGSTSFGTVAKQKTTDFQVYAQIDNLQTSISSFKVTITDPYGDSTWIDGRSSSDSNFPSDKDSFWFTTKEFSYEFKYTGKYTVRFWMKPTDSTSMQIVSEKIVISR